MPGSARVAQRASDATRVRRVQPGTKSTLESPECMTMIEDDRVRTLYENRSVAASSAPRVVRGVAVSRSHTHVRNACVS